MTMPRATTIAVLGLLLCTPVTAQRPTADEQKRTLDTAREIAIHYNNKLPDFLCTEKMERTDRTGPNNVKLDRLTVQLSYFEQKEKYKLVEMNGQKTTQTFEALDGIISGGEFGTLLAGIFDPVSAADFQWKSTATIGKHPASVYTFRIARANSHYMLGHRAGGGDMKAAAAGYHGELCLDPKTSRVLRLTASADDIPKELNIFQSSVEVDYDFMNVAGKSYLLPAHSEAKLERSYRQIANTVTFTDYRKFQAESSIDFGTGH
jgi:hypothetical protein